MEADLSAEQQKLEDRLGQQMAAKEAKALAALEAQKAALLGAGDISEDDRARQLAALQQQEAAVRAGLASDRDAAQARLRERLAARRAQGAAAAVLSGDAELPSLREDAEAEEEGPRFLPHSSDEEGPEAEEDEEAAEQRRRQQWLDGLLETSPMLKTLSDVEDLLRRIEGLPPPPCPNPGSFPAEGDTRFRLEGRLQPSDLGSLSPAAVTTLEFGRLLVRLLREKEDGPDVVLELADALPRNNYENNAFRRSFFFQHHPGVLFVRRKRAENVGDFMVILLHCLAHIAADEMVDDESPRQRKLFYRVRHKSARKASFALQRSLPLAVPAMRLSELPLLSRSGPESRGCGQRSENGVGDGSGPTESRSSASWGPVGHGPCTQGRLSRDGNAPGRHSIR